MISLSLLPTGHPSTFQRTTVRSFTVCYHSFNLPMGRSPPLRVYHLQLVFRAFHTRFPFASVPEELRLATDNNSQTHYAKGKQSSRSFYSRLLTACWPQKERDSYTLYAMGFRFYFTPLVGVLFTFPSRYLFTIGRQVVFSLIRWSGSIHAEFHLHRITWDPSRGFQTSRTRLSRSLAELSRSLRSLSTSHI